jgi:two-component system, NarL family, nitrate/nitrite response regulator NarL
MESLVLREMALREPVARKLVVACESQPLMMEGLRTLLRDCVDLKFAGGASTIAAGIEVVRAVRPAVVIIDKALGFQAISDWLLALKGTGTASVVWGSGIGNAEALRFVQAGVRGVVQKNSELESILACLRAVSEGGNWMADTILQTSPRPARSRSSLTPREAQIVELVEKGMRNKEIATRLGIQTGTVKIHLKHIFEKTGCRGRYGLALSGLREKGHLVQAVM